MDLAEARSLLQVESNELDLLKVVQAEGTSSLMARASNIMAHVR